MVWNVKARAEIVKYYFKFNSVTAAQREFRRKNDTRKAPSRNTILRLAGTFEDQGTVGRKPYHRVRPVRKPITINKVRKAVAADPHISSRGIANRTSIPRTTVQRILRRDLGLFPFKTQMLHKLKRGDKARRLRFCRWFLTQCEHNPNFAKKLMMSDEAHFHLNGVVNKQNWRVWSSENPNEFVEAEQYPQFVTVWCGVMADKIVGPYFFEENHERVTVNGKRYCEMVKNFLLPQLDAQNVSLRRMWFQQDGAGGHSAKRTIALLRQSFGNRVISKNAAVPWPPRSPDLTAPDFFLWGHLKAEVYRTPLASIAQLKRRIRKSIHKIPVQALGSVMDNMDPDRKSVV